MRILITSWPAYGHLYPMLPIARAAQHAGHDVVIATAPDMAVHVERRGFVAWPVGPSHAEAEVAMRAGHSALEAMSPEDTIRVSHGGGGTVFGALGHSLPQLFLPLGADQFWNAAACQHVGAALTLPPEALSGEAVAASVRRLIAEPAFTAAARGVQAEIDTMPTAADALAGLLTTGHETRPPTPPNAVGSVECRYVERVRPSCGRSCWS